MRKSLWLVMLLAPLFSAGATGIFHSKSNSDPWLGSSADDWRLLDPSATVTYNPYAPEGGNDGAAWQGKGWNSWLWAGAQAKWGPVSVTVEPQFWFAQNDDFSLLSSAKSDGQGDYWWGIDWLQRDGRSTLLRADWGNSEVRVLLGPWTMGMGTEAIWLGSAFRNSILLSNNAGGFPHIDLGTLYPWKTDWGVFEGRMLWGILDNSSETWDRFFHGLVVSYALPFYPEFTIGAGRLFYSPTGTVSWWKAFESVDDGLLKVYRGIYDGTVKDDDIDQLAALYFDWTLDKEKFHLYAEVARNDHSGDLKDLLIQPDHTLGYVFGMDQTIDWGSPWTLFYHYEMADLGLNMGTTVRGTGSWYRHGPNPSGYTLGGQFLGASIGPGSNSQSLEFGTTYRSVSLSVLLERVAKDMDFFYLIVAPKTSNPLSAIDVSYSYSLKGAFPWGPWSFVLQAGVSNEYDRNYGSGMDSGIRLSASASYRL